MGDFSDPTVFAPNAVVRPLLEGIIVEKRPNDDVLIGVRIKPILDALRLVGVVPPPME